MARIRPQVPGLWTEALGVAWASGHGRHDIFYHKGRLDLALGDMFLNLTQPDWQLDKGQRGFVRGVSPTDPRY
jgi:hypothetical protein